MRRKALFICFTGIDGAGKTTNTRRLVDYMKSKGLEVEYVWNRFKPLVFEPIVAVGRAIFLRRKDPNENYAKYSKAKRILFHSPVASKIYYYLSIFDYLVQTLTKIWLPLVLHKNIVCDRYAYDMVVGLAIDLGHSKEKIHDTLRKLFRLLPKPDLVFLVDTPAETAYKRKNDTPSIDFLEARRKIFLDIRKPCGMILLDGSAKPTELEKIVQDKMKALQ